MIYIFFLLLQAFFINLACAQDELATLHLKNIVNAVYNIEYEINDPFYIIENSITYNTNKIDKNPTVKTEYRGNMISKKDNNSYNVIYGKGTINIPQEKNTEQLMIHYEILNTKDGAILHEEKMIQIPYIKTENNFNKNVTDNQTYTENKSIVEKKGSNTIIDRFFNVIDTKNYILMALIVFCLGFLMSLTPCIYPMIPITISILGIDKQNFRARLKSGFLYMLGMSTIFSILGLLAASGKIVFGGLFQNTIFIAITSTVLIIMTLNMLGMINFQMYFNSTIQLPKYIQESRYLPFFYGMFGGTISSPCVSPGLVALLSIVSQQNNIFFAWLWLFLFGCGLAFPLFLIGLVMNAGFIFPQSGSWMNDLKEIIGILLCFIISNNIRIFTGIYIAYGIITVILIYFIIKKLYKTNMGKNLSHKGPLILAFFSILFIIHNGYQEYKATATVHQQTWESDFDIATEKAIREEKLLFIDITADWCSICKVVEKELFSNISFMSELSKRAVLCKIDCTKETAQNKEITATYRIKGYPTILIINPQNSFIKKQYSGDILSEDPTDIINFIDSLK